MGKKYAPTVRVHCQSGCNCDCHWEPWRIILSHDMVTQNACSHDAKVKMPGYNDMYECTRCHKFIHAVTPNKKEHGNDGL